MATKTTRHSLLLAFFLLVRSAQGADARRQTTDELVKPLGGAPSAQPAWGVVRDSISAATVVRVSFRSTHAQQSPPAEPAKITIDAARQAGYTVPRTIFGTFLEPIGNSTYNGLWAEILQNPSLEENLWDASHIEGMISERPALRKASQLGLPLPWEPLDANEGNRYEPRWGNAANSWRSLVVFGEPSHPTGIKQMVYLPAQRELHYRATLYARHLSGPSGLTISLRQTNQSDAVLAQAAIQADKAAWTKYSVSLEIPAGKLQPLEPADFAIELEGDERVDLDQLSLMPADAVDGLDPDMVRMSREMHTPLVRFGGNFTSAYHWRDGIGPRDKRISMLNIAWGIPEYNQFGTDEFLRYCQLIGAEPQIALNLGSGTPEEAAAWVRYVNQHWPGHGGRLWELGNELWGNWNLAAPTLAELPARTRRFSEAIRAVDPHARLIATGQDPDHFQEWNGAQLTNPPGTFQFLSTHFVVTTDRLNDQHAETNTIALDGFALPVGLGRRLRDMQKQIDNTPGYRDKASTGRDPTPPGKSGTSADLGAGRESVVRSSSMAKIAFTEWLWVCCDGHAAGDVPKWDNLSGALITGGFLNMLIKNADVVPISDMTGIIEFAGIWKKRGRVFATPAYYTFKLYAASDVERPVEVDSDAGHYDVHNGVSRLPEIPDVPWLDTAAALNKAGDTLTLFCVNRHIDQDVPAHINLSGFSATGDASVDSLSAPSISSANTEEKPEAVVPAQATVAVSNGELDYTFRRASITRIQFRKQ